MFQSAFIPYKGYYSTPFCRWQGNLATENSIVLGANTSKRWFQHKGWNPEMFDYLFLGITVGQYGVFYASTWAGAMMGAPHIPGVTISQACSTSTTCIYQASLGVEKGYYRNAYCLMVDRTSNGPHTIWPNPLGPGGEVVSENWNMDNFNRDPATGKAMIMTAENVAKKAGITREQCDALTLRRYEQYTEALANDRAFQKRYMFYPEVNISKKTSVSVTEDGGVTNTTKEGLASLNPVIPGGVHTYGAQTHPADGHVAFLITTKEKAKEMSADSKVEIQVISYGFARAEKAHMPAAVVPAVRMALAKAGLRIDEVKTIKTHNPFAANDLYLAKELDVDVNGFNNYGSPLIFGHPQAPTAGRQLIEGIEETVMAGGGYLLFGGCAAGDTAASLVLRIEA
jgi:acetyl-CoA acetyltransferase